MKYLWAILFLAFTTAALAQTSDDPLGTGHTHEGDIGNFYQSWKRPGMRNDKGERYASCCGGQDCRPILGFQEHPGGMMTIIARSAMVPAHWEILLQNLSGGQSWYAVPDDMWEDAQIDPRESPNETGHACITYSGFVICAVRASGQ